MSRWTPAKMFATAAPHNRRKAAAMQRAEEVSSFTKLPLLSQDDLPVACDPYLRWALQTQWMGFARMGLWLGAKNCDAEDEYSVGILVEASDPIRIQALREIAKVPDFYSEPLSQGGKPSLFAAARIKLSSLAKLVHHFPDLKWKLSAPLKPQDASPPGSAKGYLGRRVAPAGVPVRTISVSTPSCSQAVGQAAVRGGTVAVIDFGCPFLHSSFSTPQGDASRVVALWDQGDVRPDVPWLVPCTAGYGGELGASALRAAWENSRDPDCDLDEAGYYKELSYLVDYEDPRSRVYRVEHGAHVMDVAGGVVNPVNGESDAASRANLVFVQLPYQTATDSSGGSLGAYLLDALRYILRISDENAPLVVTVSYGSTAGPHDGTSLIERAMDELLLQRPLNTAIVLSAGNSRCAGLHVKRRARGEASAMFRLAIAPGDTTDTFVEFWYPKPTRGVLQFRARLPGGEWSQWLEPDSSVELHDNVTHETVAALINQSSVPNGQRSMALLAMRPTEAPDGDTGSLAKPGIWEVEARLNGAQETDSVDIDAWVERDDPRPFSNHKQTSFVGLEPSDAENTLSSIATGRHTVVVGGFRGSDGVAVDYSSTGPRHKKQWPMTHAVCERDSIDQGLRAAAVRSGETWLMNGTSVAAPVMARQIFNVLHEAQSTGNKQPLDRAQLRQKLVALSRQRGSPIRVDPD
jgi:hypothetical protein